MSNIFGIKAKFQLDQNTTGDIPFTKSPVSANDLMCEINTESLTVNFISDSGSIELWQLAIILCMFIDQTTIVGGIPLAKIVYNRMRSLAQGYKFWRVVERKASSTLVNVELDLSKGFMTDITSKDMFEYKTYQDRIYLKNGKVNIISLMLYFTAGDYMTYSDKGQAFFLTQVYANLRTDTVASFEIAPVMEKDLEGWTITEIAPKLVELNY